MRNEAHNYQGRHSCTYLHSYRTLVSEEPVAYDPERALADVVSYTHYLPRHWRGRAHTDEVQVGRIMTVVVVVD